jgi:hypothetical protein
MAATNFTPISLYYSTTPAAVPIAGNLTNGELAINIHDKKLYAKDNAGVVFLLASADGTTGTVSTVSVTSANGFAGTVANPTTTPAITISTSVTGLLKGNGTAISAATSGTDYAPATSGTSILYGNGSGGFSNVTVGSGLTFAAGTLAASGGGTVSSVAQSFTGGLISVAGSPITTSGTLALTVAGTSGGVPYFSSGTTWASSAALTQYGIVYGGGAGAAPATTAVGAAGQVLTSNGAGVAPTFQTASGGISTGKSIAMAMIFGF